MRPRRCLERNRDCVRTGFAPGRPPPVHPRLTGACAAMRGFQICVSGHAQMQRPPSAWAALRPCFTMSNSPLRGLARSPSRSRGAFLRPGWCVVALCRHRISAAWPALRRARAQILGVSCSSDPEMRGRRSAGRRTTLIRRVGKTRPHACEACPSRATGTSASRRSTVAFRPGARCVSGISAGAGARLARRQSFMAGYGPRAPSPRLRAAADATPRSAVRIVSGDAPHERGWESFTIYSLRSQ